MSETRRLALVLGFTQTLAWATTFYIPAVIVGAAARTLGESQTVLLGGFSWSLLIASIASPFVGRRIDHRNFRVDARWDSLMTGEKETRSRDGGN